MSDADRFWKKVDRRGPDDCWNWTAFKEPRGYGKFRFKGGSLAHRFSYQLANRKPGEKQVLHRCDNPSCVNPAHLFLGTRQDNMDDRNKKGRQALGIRNAKAILDDNKVTEIRKRAAAGEMYKDLAAEYGVAECTAQQAGSGLTWKHIPMGGRFG